MPRHISPVEKSKYYQFTTVSVYNVYIHIIICARKSQLFFSSQSLNSLVINGILAFLMAIIIVIRN